MKVNTCVSNVYVYWIHAKSKYQIVKTRLTANVSVLFRRSGREFAARNWEIVRHLCGLPTTQYVIFELILLEITDKTMNLLSFARDPVMCVFFCRATPWVYLLISELTENSLKISYLFVQSTFSLLRACVWQLSCSSCIWRLWTHINSWNWNEFLKIAPWMNCQTQYDTKLCSVFPMKWNENQLDRAREQWKHAIFSTPCKIKRSCKATIFGLLETCMHFI